MDQFKVLKQLGAGSFGQALLCRDAKTREFVVVKKVFVRNTKALGEAEHEASLLREHAHANVCRFISCFADADAQTFYLVMEYADGGDLAGAISRRKPNLRYWPEADAMAIFVMCTLALRHVHSKRVIHRDIKAANVFLTKAGVVKLGDFGVSTRLDADSGGTRLARTQVGTPYYLSPEIFEGRPYKYASDIWALGVLLFEVLALKVPFDAPSLAALCRLVTGRRGPPPPPAHYSKDAAALVRSLLERIPDKRPSADDLARKHPFVRRHMQDVLTSTADGQPLRLSDDVVARADASEAAKERERHRARLRREAAAERATAAEQRLKERCYSVWNVS